MKQLTVAIVAVALASFVKGEELKSGLQTGEFIGAFYVTKLAGADNDGVQIGKSLCYRCRNGGRPQVMIFTRSDDPKVAELVKSLDVALQKNKKRQLRAFVNYLGEDKSAAAKRAQQLAAASKVKHIPFVVPHEFENGPGGYGISAKAEVTVILAGGSQVKATHAVASAKDLNVESVIADIGKILN